MLESYGQTALLKELIYRWERNRELCGRKVCQSVVLNRLFFSCSGRYIRGKGYTCVRTRWSNGVYQQDLPRFTRVPCTPCIQLLDESDFYSYERRTSLDEREKNNDER